jgi:hypothetical protein
MLLNWSDDEFAGMFNHGDGRPMLPHEVKAVLRDELANGRELIPCDDCDNFDFVKGCMGHPVETEPPLTSEQLAHLRETNFEAWVEARASLTVFELIEFDGEGMEERLAGKGGTFRRDEITLSQISLNQLSEGTSNASTAEN